LDPLTGGELFFSLGDPIAKKKPNKKTKATGKIFYRKLNMGGFKKLRLTNQRRR